MYNPLLTNAILFIVLIGVLIALVYLKDSLCEDVVAILLTVNLAAVFVSWEFRYQLSDFAVSLLAFHEPLLASFLAIISAIHLRRFKTKWLVVSLMILNFAIGGLFSAFLVSLLLAFP